MRPFILFMLVLAGSYGLAQNLVPNPSFEINSALPTGPGQYIRCTDWNNVNLWPSFSWPYASPDYLHSSGSGGAQLPASVFGNCSPFNGSAVMGTIAWHGTTPNFREYFACQLTSPMIPGQTYDIVLTVRNAVGGYGGYGSNGIQVAFSVAPLYQATHEPIAVTPQLAVGSIFFNSTWQQLTFSFTPTQPFQHMTVGNFQNDASTLRSFSGSGGNASYFFFDGMSVTQVAVLDQGRLSLKGEAKGTQNLLEWENEGESTGFEVFRSTDGAQFVRLTSLNSDDLMSYRDDAPNYGTNWYKVRRNNPDGSVTFSNVLALENTGTSPLQLVSLYPNPVEVSSGIEEIHVMIEHPPLEEIATEMYDMTGRKVLSRSFQVAGERVSTLDLPVSGLAAGVYSLRVMAGGEVLSRQVVVGR